MNACYILFTAAYDKFYIGATHDDVHLRVMKHNTKAYDNTSTSFTSDWVIYLIIECTSYAQAINIERHIKSMKSKIYISNLKKYPEIVSRLLQQYQST